MAGSGDLLPFQTWPGPFVTPVPVCLQLRKLHGVGRAPQDGGPHTLDRP